MMHLKHTEHKILYFYFQRGLGFALGLGFRPRLWLVNFGFHLGFGKPCPPAILVLLGADRKLT